MLAACLGVLGLAGCGKEAESGTKQEKVRLMVWSPSEDQSKESGEWLQTMCESFAEENPQWDITFVYGVADEATAATQVSQDPEASADVFMFANDTLTIMTDANALAKFGGTYREEIEASNTPEVLKSLTMNDELYGVPFTTNKAFTCENTTLEGEGRFPTGISYLKKLGVNYVQIMPMYDYGSVDESGEIPGFNWGYDPVNYNVPEGSYSTDPYHGEVRIKELKEMVQSLHKNGFRVIMDVVYNHTYSLESWFQKTAPWYFYRVWEDGSISNGSACGNDVASERTMCAKYILGSVLYWTEEYHIDGFRFDLMGLLDVKLMNQIRRELDARYGKGEKLVFGEPWRAEKTAMEGEALPADKEHIGLLDEQIGMFSDDTRDAIKGSVFEADETLEVKAPSQIITYVSAHDNHTLWDKLSETTKNKKQRQKEYRLAAGIYLTCQGTPFFLSGEEFARTKGGRDNTYNASIDINRLNWKQAEQASRSFAEKFWMPEKSCLKDVISGTYADEQIRCNQIWAVSMPFSILDGEKEQQIVETVFEKLYTSYGLRTLEEADEQFHPVYEGGMKDRDMAYHQGTVWTFPLGAYYLAYLKVYNYSETAKQTVTEQLEIMESALREGCIGQLPEIYDGKNPVSSKGCFAQAWSVGEILRVYEQLEKNNNPSACKK